MVSVFFVVVNLGVTGCAGTGKTEAKEGTVPEKGIQQVQEEHTDRWMSIPGVVGTAIIRVDGKPCIRVMVADKTKEMMKRLPARVEGYRVVVEETGQFRALD